MLNIRRAYFRAINFVSASFFLIFLATFGSQAHAQDYTVDWTSPNEGDTLNGGNSIFFYGTTWRNVNTTISYDSVLIEVYERVYPNEDDPPIWVFDNNYTATLGGEQTTGDIATQTIESDSDLYIPGSPKVKVVVKFLSELNTEIDSAETIFDTN